MRVCGQMGERIFCNEGVWADGRVFCNEGVWSDGREGLL